MGPHGMAGFFWLSPADSEEDFAVLLMGVLFYAGKFLRFADPLL